MAQTILLVDDRQDSLAMHLHFLRGSALVVATASTLAEIDEEYERHRADLVAIVLDGCVPGQEVNTFGFIERVRADIDAGEYTGLLVAASSRPDFREDMVAAGCTHEASKTRAVKLVRQLLAL